jgi:hypothetical protein
LDDSLESHRQLRSPAQEGSRTGDAQIDDAPDLTTLPSANEARFSEAIHDTREPLHRWAWRRQPLAFRLRFFQAAKSRLRRRTNAANTSPVNRAKYPQDTTGNLKLTWADDPVSTWRLKFHGSKIVRVRAATQSPKTSRSESKKVWNTRSHRPSGSAGCRLR